MEEQEQLIERVVAILRDEFGDDLLGVLATGSRIHGAPGPTSDLDAHVLIASPRRQRRNFVLDGVEIELFINPPFQIRRYMADDDRGSDQHMFTFGRVVYDPHGTVAALQAEARQLWEAGPPGKLAWMQRYGVADLLRDVEDIAASDEATANLLIAELVDQLIDTHGRLNQRWPEKAKRRLGSLARWDERAAQLARSALAAPSLQERRTAVEQLADYVLAPLGGLMPLEWRTEWDQVSET